MSIITSRRSLRYGIRNPELVRNLDHIMADLRRLDAAFPIGMLSLWPGGYDSIPGNFLPCDGRQVPVNTYPKLAELYPPVASNTNMIQLPDLRGLFLQFTKAAGGTDKPLQRSTQTWQSGTGFSITTMQWTPVVRAF